ncbi:MAG: polyprenyl synthetase, partial [Prevotellaceae bacterium]|nr:polyprenyl synthetase [Prevotellaceae bacterium]
MDKQFYLVPKTHEERNRLRRLIKNFVDVHSLVPPLSLEELSYLSDNIIREHLLDEAWKAWLMVEIHNSTWQDVVAAIPYEKRI